MESTKALRTMVRHHALYMRHTRKPKAHKALERGQRAEVASKDNILVWGGDPIEAKVCKGLRHRKQLKYRALCRALATKSGK